MSTLVKTESPMSAHAARACTASPAPSLHRVSIGDAIEMTPIERRSSVASGISPVAAGPVQRALRAPLPMHAPFYCPTSGALLTNAYIDSHGRSYQVREGEDEPGVDLSTLEEPVPNVPVQKAIAAWLEGDATWTDALTCPIAWDFAPLPVVWLGVNPAPAAPSFMPGEWPAYGLKASEDHLARSSRGPCGGESLPAKVLLRPNLTVQALNLVMMENPPDPRDTIYPAGGDILVKVGSPRVPRTWANGVRARTVEQCVLPIFPMVVGGVVLGGVAAALKQLPDMGFQPDGTSGAFSLAQLGWGVGIGAAAGLLVGLVICAKDLHERRVQLRQQAAQQDTEAANATATGGTPQGDEPAAVPLADEAEPPTVQAPEAAHLG